MCSTVVTRPPFESSRLMVVGVCGSWMKQNVKAWHGRSSNTAGHQVRQWTTCTIGTNQIHTRCPWRIVWAVDRGKTAPCSPPCSCKRESNPSAPRLFVTVPISLEAMYDAVRTVLGPTITTAFVISQLLGSEGEVPVFYWIHTRDCW